MKNDTYKHVVEVLGKRPTLRRIIRCLDLGIVGLTALSYLMLLGYDWVSKDYENLYHCILVPAVGFVGVSIFRKFYHANRPYEDMGFEPLIPKETKGKSFPSRHVFSIFMIAMTFATFNLEIAMELCLLGCILAMLRVLAGVHYIKDVLAGAGMAIFIGWLGYFVIFAS